MRKSSFSLFRHNSYNAIFSTSNSRQHGKFTPELIAPCGMNCGICVAFFGYTMNGKKRKHTCITCRLRKRPCAFIKKQCDKLKDGEIEYCFECMDFPCKNLTTLDRRYKAKYGMSMIENLQELKEKGMETFLENQERKYTCPKCGDIICVHDRKCYSCGYIQTD